jgi:hypothetical protein
MENKGRQQEEQEKKESKQINIVGTNNRYQMKKVTKQKSENKKRVESEKWSFSDEYYHHDKQLELLNMILINIRISNNKPGDDVIKIIIQQIHNKINGYKQQDNLKKMFDEEQFVTFENIVERLVDCEIKCYYCKKEMMVLYDISR